MIINQRNIDKKSNFNNIIIDNITITRKHRQIYVSQRLIVLFFFFPVGHKAIYIISRVEMVPAKGEEAV